MEEFSFKDLTRGTGMDKAGYGKIKFCGEQAKHDNLQYFWVHTCCIDKSDSVELQEAINSMFRWYQNAAKCYVYLATFHALRPMRRSSSAQYLGRQHFAKVDGSLGAGLYKSFSPPHVSNSSLRKGLSSAIKDRSNVKSTTQRKSPSRHFEAAHSRNSLSMSGSNGHNFVIQHAAKTGHILFSVSWKFLCLLFTVKGG